MEVLGKICYNFVEMIVFVNLLRRSFGKKETSQNTWLFLPKKEIFRQIRFNTMLLLINCVVHKGKYLDRSFEVRTERSEVCTKNYDPNISHMGRTDWSIRALLYSHNQH